MRGHHTDTGIAEDLGERDEVAGPHDGKWRCQGADVVRIAGRRAVAGEVFENRDDARVEHAEGEGPSVLGHDGGTGAVRPVADPVASTDGRSARDPRRGERFNVDVGGQIHGESECRHTSSVFGRHGPELRRRTRFRCAAGTREDSDGCPKMLDPPAFLIDGDEGSSVATGVSQRS